MIMMQRCIVSFGVLIHRNSKVLNFSIWGNVSSRMRGHRKIIIPEQGGSFFGMRVILQEICFAKMLEKKRGG